MGRFVVGMLVVALLPSCRSGGETMGERSNSVVVSKMAFGTCPDGPVDLYVLENGNGVRVAITTYGGIVTDLEFPDRTGQRERVVLGFDTLQGYLDGHPYFGCITGRYCNRIDRGRFSIDGREVAVSVNNGAHHLHGGTRGFDKHLWMGLVQREGPDKAGVLLTRVSPDGEEGFPGNLSVRVWYMLDDQNQLTVSYEAITDAPTVVNLTHHSYWNLGGAGSGSVGDHVLQLNAAEYTPADETLIPTGAIDPVAGSPLDFTTPTAIGARLGEVPGGYDHNYVVLGEPGTLRPHAVLEHPMTGRRVAVLSTEPGIQFYSGNFLDGVRGASGRTYAQHGGLCLEPQHYPDSPNKPHWPTVVLRPGEKYQSTTVFQFSATAAP